MAVSRAVSSLVSSPDHSSDELSDHYDTDIDSDDDILDINTSHLRHGPQHHPMSPQIPARQSSRQAQETRYYNDKKTDFEGDRPLAHDSSIYFDEYWKEFGRRRQQGQRYPAKPRYNYPQHQPHLSDGKMSARFPGGSAGHDAFAYHDSRQRRPLITYVNNGWQSSSSNSGTSDIDHGTPSAGQILAAPMIRRILYTVSAFLLILWYWGSWGKPSRDENRAIETAIAGRKSVNGQYFGSNLRPDFIGMKHMDVLDEDLIPGNGRIERLVAVGDVHGCHEELTALLTQISFTPSTDHLIFTGDMISKGPSSPAVIDLAIQYNASCVRGNHEDRVLLAHRDLSTHTLTSFKRSSQRKSNIKKDTSEDLTGPSETDDYIDEPVASVLPAHGDPSTTSHELDTEHFPTGRALDRDLASVLTPPQLRYLKSCPVLLHLGSLPPLGPTTVVHAGLVPGVSLQQQDPMGAMHMRTLDLATYVPSPDSNGGATWSRVWEKYQNRLPAKERSTVIYGHDSKKGLQVKNKWSKGLDSGCVKGGKLSALVYTRRKEGESEKVEIVSVGCKDYRPKRGGDVVELGQS